LKQATVTPDPLSLASALGHEVRTVPAVLQARAQLSPDAAALWALSPSGDWKATTWRRFHDVVAAGASGFRAMGVQREDRVGIMAPSSA